MQAELGAGLRFILIRPLIALLVASLSAGLAFAEPILPENPRLRDFPKGPRGAIAFYTTTVAKGNDGTFQVMKGFIYGKLSGDAIYVVHNPKTGLSCDGKTTRAADRSGKGSMSCSLDGKPLGTMPFDIPAAVYGKFRGTTTGKLVDPRGRQIGVFMTRWGAWKFPDPAEMLAAFK